MTAVLQLVRLYLTTYPVQRWIAIGAGVLVVVVGIPTALWMAPQARNAPTGIFVAFLIPIMIALVPAPLAAASIVRFLASKRSNRLVPHLRLKLLLSAFLLTVLVTFVFGVLASGPASFSEDGPTTLQLFMAIFAGTSALMYIVYRITSMAAWAFVEFLILLTLPTVVPSLPGQGGAALSAFTLSLVGWVVFSLWFLSERPIRPVDFAGRGARMYEKPKIPANPKHERAVATLLTTRYFGSPLAELGVGVMLAVVLTSLFAFLHWLMGDTDAQFPLELFALSGGLAAGMSQLQFARRARYLWLLEPTRDRIFSLVERLTAALSIRVIVFGVLIAAGVHWIVDPLSIGRVVEMLSVMIGTMVFASYLSMFMSRGLGPLMIIVWIVVIIGAVLVAIGMINDILSLGTVLIIVAAELVAGVVLRALARRRWQTVDWTAYKPFDWSTAGLRS